MERTGSLASTTFRDVLDAPVAADTRAAINRRRQTPAQSTPTSEARGHRHERHPLQVLPRFLTAKTRQPRAGRRRVRVCRATSSISPGTASNPEALAARLAVQPLAEKVCPVLQTVEAQVVLTAMVPALLQSAVSQVLERQGVAWEEQGRLRLAIPERGFRGGR